MDHMIPGRVVATASLLVLGTLAVAAHSPDAAQEPVRWRVGLRGYGPVRYGMTLPEVSRVLREPLSVADPDCDYVRPQALPPGVALMVVDGRVERVDVDTTGVATLSGVAVGTTETAVRDAYPGRIETRPHPYTGPEGHYLVFVPHDPGDRQFRIVFETDGVTVTSFRAGRRPAVEYIEGCL